MSILLQVDFPYGGPWGDAMSEAMRGLAESIAGEPGLIWKIWTENEANHEAGGIYLFRDEDTAQAYIKKHTARLKHLGVEDVTFKIFDINEPLSKINHGHIG